MQAFEPVAYELADIDQLIGTVPLDVLRSGAPSIMVSDRMHNEANRWLELRSEELRNQDTVWTLAKRLREWIEFLADRDRTVHTASEVDYRAYEAAKRWPDDAATAVGDGWWTGTSSAIKIFHEWLREAYGTPLPFTLVKKRRPDGTPIWGIAHAGRMTTGRSGAVPLGVDHANALVAATQRSTPSGRDRANASRDRAFVELVLGTGIRIAPASLLTHYEFPSLGTLPLSHFKIPAQINKYKRGVQGYGFAYRLRAVEHYLKGERRLAVLNTQHDPSTLTQLQSAQDRSPLTVIEAGPDRVVYETLAGQRFNRAWDDVTAEVRLRLVDMDGTSPLIFVSSTGRPLTIRSLRDIVSKAGHHANELDRRFPQRVYPHMLRHTYGTHMAALWTKGLPDPDLDPEMRERFRGDYRVVDAVRLVQTQLGHRDQKTTDIYTQHVELLLGEHVDRLLGR